MSKIWVGMIGLGIIFSGIHGNLSSVNDIIMNSSEQAVMFVLGLSGIMAVWSGLLKIAEESGLIQLLAKKAEPFVSKIFPEEKNQETMSLMCMCFAANVFGVGNTATVFGIQAMKRLDEENHRSFYASNTMCMFLAITMSSIQLIPVTVLKVRSETGSINPEDIILPTLIATLISTITAVLVCKWFECGKYGGAKE